MAESAIREAPTSPSAAGRGVVTTFTMPQFARLALSYLGWLGLAIYLIFGAPGCAGSRQDRWTPEPELTAPAMRAAEDWCVATDGRYCPQIMAQGMPIRVASAAEQPSSRGPVCGWAHGHISRISGSYSPAAINILLASVDAGECLFAVEMTRDETLVAILRHELGHAAGLKDVDDPSRIMHWRSDQSGEISDADVAEMGEINGW